MKKRLSWIEERRREVAEERAVRELDWFFVVMNGRVPEVGEGPSFAREAALAIDGWLRDAPPFHRGAFALRHSKRDWPEALREEFGRNTTLVVHLECVSLWKGSRGSRGELEQLAVEGLLAEIERCKRREKAVAGTKWAKVRTRAQARLDERHERAGWHVRSAIRAYAKARGRAKCVLPRGVYATVERNVDITDALDFGKCHTAEESAAQVPQPEPSAKRPSLEQPSTAQLLSTDGAVPTAELTAESTGASLEPSSNEASPEASADESLPKSSAEEPPEDSPAQEAADERLLAPGGEARLARERELLAKGPTSTASSSPDAVSRATTAVGGGS